ncbi:ribosomal protein L35 [Chloropicon primus]|uniref:50S ribosomal protein L35 n=2 Tax=Chloropicon primus TaxID=1764295 RepID=A0A5B8MW64_9CHLO|nr:ribosomal protein L35 [Chloropicon primus]UPR03078.1 ribosomal protein L35 [Chloropicon primus]|eukprot:QDZ23865.1 ribosomal protein L35 [Chloropicon primus]
MRGLAVGGPRRVARAPRNARAARAPRGSLAPSALGSKAAVSSVASLGVVDSPARVEAPTREVTTSKYKLKTRKAAAKRFKVTGNGKVLRRKQGKQHLNTKKNAKRKRFLSAPAVVEKSDIPNIKGSMPLHKIKG